MKSSSCFPHVTGLKLSFFTCSAIWSCLIRSVSHLRPVIGFQRKIIKMLRFLFPLTIGFPCRLCCQFNQSIFYVVVSADVLPCLMQHSWKVSYLIFFSLLIYSFHFAFHFAFELHTETKKFFLGFAHGLGKYVFRLTGYTYSS